ncbi:MAG: hypothetical protein BWY77_01647 [bacterium ADurb.Bin431]|nr:MAG: hypothetical protein BWY77_01647 [bacterium ADurb.Bin431]
MKIGHITYLNAIDPGKHTREPLRNQARQDLDTFLPGLLHLPGMTGDLITTLQADDRHLSRTLAQRRARRIEGHAPAADDDHIPVNPELLGRVAIDVLAMIDTLHEVDG